MDFYRFDRLTRRVRAAMGRRTLLKGAAGIGAAIVGHVARHDATAARNLCRRNGTRCRRKSERCRAEFCLKTPFTIEARWTNPETDQDTYLFVPNEAGSDVESPYIEFRCNSEETNDGALYPYAFVNQDAQGPGHEITTVRRLLPGRYEYWILVYAPSPAKDVKVKLRNADGRAVRSWTSPPNPSLDPAGLAWHVFDIAGRRRSVTSVDRVVAGSLPDAAHVPNTNVCPD